MRAAALVLFLLVATGAYAQLQTRPAPFEKKGGGGNVTCTINSVTSVAFGHYDSESAIPQTSTGQLRFSCKPGKTLTIKVSIGASSVTGSITDRAMREAGGSDQLHYNLFQDQRGSIVWGDGTTGGSPAFVTGKKDFNVEIYGIARPGQSPAEGLYGDFLRITVLP